MSSGAYEELSYIFNEAGLRITSLGISANGAREMVREVSIVGGAGNPGAKVGVLEPAGVLGNIPAARSLSSRELVSEVAGADTDVEVAGGVLYGGSDKF